MATLLSAARPAQDALLRLKALAGPLLRTHSPLMRLKREVAAMEAAELMDFHQAGIALARANVVNCDIATGAAKKALMAEMSKFSFDSSDAESDAESCESSSEENSGESEGGWPVGAGGGGGGEG